MKYLNSLDDLLNKDQSCQHEKKKKIFLELLEKCVLDGSFEELDLLLHRETIILHLTSKDKINSKALDYYFTLHKASDCNKYLRCFEVERRAKILQKKFREYKDDYNRIINKANLISEEIILSCKTQKELKILLLETSGTHKFFRKPESLAYPRLRLAIECKGKNLVGLQPCQWLLRQQWVAGISWYGRGTAFKLLYILLQMLGTPLFCLAHIFRLLVKDLTTIDCMSETSRRLLRKIESFEKWNPFINLDTPINRCISYFFSMLAMTFLLIECVLAPFINWDNDPHPRDLLTLRWYHKLLLYMTISFGIRLIIFTLITFALSLQLHLAYKQALLFASLECDPYYSLLNMSEMTATNCTLEEDPSKMYETEIMWTNTLFSISTTISYIHFLYWLQLNPTIGPVVISASQVVVDVLTIGSLYLVLLCAFTSGIIFIIGTEKLSQSLNMTYASLNSEPVSYDPIQLYSESFLTTLESLFWSWLGPGESDLHVEGSSSRSVLIKVLVGFYQVIAVIVFLNLLIASMNTTLQKIQDHREVYWKFARAGLWIRFFDESSALPPPWNLFTVIRDFARFTYKTIRKMCMKRNSRVSPTADRCADNTSTHNPGEDYHNLMLQIIRRLKARKSYL